MAYHQPVTRAEVEEIRGVALSRGTLDGDLLVCGYHGACYDGDGHCRRVPSQAQIPPGAMVRGFPLVQRGALACASAAEAASGAALTIVCVIDTPQCEAVLFGDQGVTSRSGAPGHTVMLCPTISPQDVESLAQRLQAVGIATIDSPMSGGPQRASDGSMSLMVEIGRAHV